MNGQKVVCGSQGGVVNIFKYGYWGDINDRYPGHPESIDTIAKVSENVLVTGSSDGLIRVVEILPNKILGVVGGHDGFPIERIKMSRDNNILASCSHDNSIKFWDVSFFWGKGNVDDISDAEDGGNQGSPSIKKKKHSKHKKGKMQNRFFLTCR